MRFSTSFSTSKTLVAAAIGAVCSLYSSDSFGQVFYQTYADYNAPFINSLSLGTAANYAGNLFLNSYIGFNVDRNSGNTWHTKSDGGNNGGAAITSSIGGSMYFLTLPNTGTSGSRPEQNVPDANFGSITRMVLTADGNLRIGATSPTSPHADAKLSVDGKIIAKSFFVNSQNWADYVFDENYKLAPLTEVEAYVKQNKHLPEIPTTCEVEETGVDVSAMNTLLLKKVEELTLHLIQMDKRVKELETGKE